MASHDIRRLNPGIQVDKLYVGTASKVNPHLAPETSEVTMAKSTFTTPNINEVNDSPSPFSFDSSSGSILILTPP